MDKKVKEVIKEVVEKEGFFLVDTAFKKQEGKLSLVVTIDSKNGVSVEDCSYISKLLDPLLDEIDIIKEKYLLVVSSPGV